jgi:hypothetical protein
MARADYIWFITLPGADLAVHQQVLAVFTVKHEMVAWRRRAVLPDALGQVQVARMRDGGQGLAVDLGTGEDVLKAATQ